VHWINLRSFADPLVNGHVEFLIKLFWKAFFLSLLHGQVLEVTNVLSTTAMVVENLLVLRNQLAPLCLASRSVADARGKANSHNVICHFRPLVHVRSHEITLVNCFFLVVILDANCVDEDQSFSHLPVLAPLLSWTTFAATRERGRINRHL